MHAYIKKLQSKSEDARKRILISSLIVCMSLFGFIWINSLGYRLNNVKENVAKTEETIKPFAIFGQTVKDTYKNVTASVGSVSSLKKEEVNTETKVETEKQIDLIPVEYINQ